MPCRPERHIRVDWADHAGRTGYLRIQEMTGKWSVHENFMTPITANAIDKKARHSGPL